LDNIRTDYKNIQAVNNKRISRTGISYTAECEQNGGGGSKEGSSQEHNLASHRNTSHNELERGLEYFSLLRDKRETRSNSLEKNSRI
jgi:hypothetical protein